MPQITLEITSLDKQVFNGKVASVTVPATEGQLTILPNHLPLVTPLTHGEVIIRETEGKEEYLVVGNGFLVVADNKVTILADNADLLDSLYEEKIWEARQHAENILKERKFADDREFADASAALEQYIMQLKVLKKRKKTH